MVLKFKKGFSLVELLVVIAIIGILAAVGITAYSGYTKKLLWECKNKHKWNATPWAVIRNKEWCDTCK